MPQGCPNLFAWPISGNPSHHQEFLRKLQHSSYPLGSLSPSPATTQHLLNGLFGVTRDPTFGPKEDVVNFLSELSVQLCIATELGKLITYIRYY